MLLGIIKNETSNISYYINLDKKENYNELSVIETTKDTIRFLNKVEAINLLKTILSSKLTYKEKYNDYDIYLDEANNKRYFKNGKENYFMFLENNGVNAIKCFEKNNKVNLHTKAYKIIASTIGFSLIFSTVALIPVADDTKFFEGTKYVISSAVELTPFEATNLIKNSFYLSSEEKKQLANEDYFEFVLNNTESKDREYYLRNSLNNLRIKHYDPDFFPGTEGYYNPLDINAINICNTVTPENDKYMDVITHEFIHSTQDQNDYLYLIEATAEMLEYEFYNEPCDGYPELVKRTKVLMEILGPEPVISCIYSGDTKYFENTIKQYLSEEEAEKLLNLFKTSADALYENDSTMNTTNMQIDNLLSIMYKNKTGKNINDDMMIRIIYATNTNRRIYFNEKHPEYNKDYYVTSNRVVLDELDMNEVVNSGNVTQYSYSTVTMRSLDGTSIPFYNNEQTNNFNDIIPEENQIVNIRFKDGTRGITRYDFERNQWSPVEHFDMVKVYEPSIFKKFPDQIKNPIKIKEIPEKENSEAKWL